LPAEQGHILVVDDHPEMAQVLAEKLIDVGYTAQTANSAAEAHALARARLPDLVIADLRMENRDGFDVVADMHALDRQLPVLIMTAFGAIDTAVEAIKRGAYHYIAKPFQLKEVLIYVERALEERRLRDEARALRRVAEERAQFGAMVGRSEALRQLYDLVERVAVANVPALVRGESGVGKELVARTLHFASPRRERTFVPVNCTAIPGELLESELFGHLRGAFTGASEARRGLFVEADGGTLFFDEIGDMPPELQAKLLRVLEDGEIRPIGSDATRKVDVRIIAATHQPLEEHVKAGKFRADLFYRLNVVPIHVPPLRERPEDIPLLVQHFLTRSSPSPTSGVRSFSPDALAKLCGHSWPGNVRELENLVKRLLVVSTAQEVDAAEIARLVPALSDSPPPVRRASIVPLRQVEDEYIAWVVEQCGGNKTRAAELLHIDVSTIHRREKGK
jgi:two-component system, NtrC family, response regulator HydG